MSFWQPELRREWLQTQGILLEHSLAYDATKPMGNWGKSQVAMIVMAHLVGLGPAMIDLAPQAIDWIDRAIARDEFTDDAGGRVTALGQILEAKAVAQWLMTSSNPVATWNEAFENRKLGCSGLATERVTRSLFNEYLDDSMACGLQAGRCSESVDFYAEFCDVRKVSVRSIRTPRRLAYELCQRSIGRQSISDEDLIRAGHQILQTHLAEHWLHNGQYLRAAIWLKIVHELANPEAPPAAVILMAYDDMPTIPRPAFLDEAPR